MLKGTKTILHDLVPRALVALNMVFSCSNLVFL